MSKGISAAEKYAGLETAGLPRPVCECHGESMCWAADVRRAAGGHWRCPVKNRARRRRYAQTEKGREAQRAANRRYAQTEKGREAQRAASHRYKQTEKGREAQRAASHRYAQTEKGREARRRYAQTEKGREAQRRYEDTRIRVSSVGGMIRETYRVPPEKKGQLVVRLAEFRAGQRAEYSEHMASLSSSDSAI